MRVYRIELPNIPIISLRDSHNPETYSMLASGFMVNNSKKENERLFEGVRTKSYSQKPSRTTSIFAFQDIETAKWFQQSGRMEANGILTEHKVTRLDVLHKGDMDLYNASCNIIGQWEDWKDKNMFQGMTAIEAQRKMVEAYWEGKRYHPEKNTMELLIQGRVEFVQRLNN